MTLNPIDLLRQLGSGVRPDGAAMAPRAAGAKGPNEGVESLDFASLLQKARAGQLSSGRPVEIEAGSGVALSEAQLGRLARAVDAAEAAGATRLLAMIDGKSVVVDVTTRSVTGGATDASGLQTNIDAAVVIGPDGGNGEPGAILPLKSPDAPASGFTPGRIENHSLARILERLEGALKAG